MSYSLVWMPDVLLAAGLKVANVPGWENRGRGDIDTERGVMCHHTASRAAGNMPTLRRGDSGELVRQLQGALGLTPDGFFGAMTEAALRDFQRRASLVPDGIAGPKTWAQLDVVPAFA